MFFLFLLSFVFSGSYAFNLSAGRWANAASDVKFSYSLKPVNAPELINDAWVDICETAILTWTEINTVDFNFTFFSDDCGLNCESGNNENEIFWYDANTAPLFLPSTALGVTLRRRVEGSIIEADIVINKSFDQANPNNNGFCLLSEGTYTDCFDFESVIVHELGHFFGLDHTSEDPDISSDDTRRLATMYYSMNYGEDNLKSLEQDDKDAMTCLYPLTGEPFRVEACCSSQNPLHRGPGCSHGFSSSSNETLDVGSGGCGTLINSNDDINRQFFSGYVTFFLLLLPLIFLFILRFISKKKLILTKLILLGLIIQVIDFSPIYSASAQSKEDDIEAEIRNELELGNRESDAIESSMRNKETKRPDRHTVTVKEKTEQNNEDENKDKKLETAKKVIELYQEKEDYRRRPLYSGIGFGFIIGPDNYLKKIFTDLENSGVQGITSVGGYTSFKVEAGMENVFNNIDFYLLFSYFFSKSKSGSGSLSYGLEPVETSVSSRLTGYPVMLGVRYRFMNYQRFRIGVSTGLGFWISRGFLDFDISDESVLTLEDSSIKFGGTGFSSDCKLFLETKLHNFIGLQLDAGYTFMLAPVIKVLSSTGEFSNVFITNSRLMIYNSTNDSSTPFKNLVNGFTIMLSVKSIF